MPSLRYALDRCASTVFSVTNSACAISRFDGPAPAPACCTPPPHPAALSSTTKRARLSRSGRLTIAVTGAGTLKATGTVKVGHRTLRFRTAHAKLTAGRTAKITLALAHRDSKLAVAALKHGRLTASITLTAGAAVKRLKITLTR
jgi:hypothetical protein